jgi:hypothetical protein
VVLSYYLFHVEKQVCLSCDVQVTGASWWAAMRIEAEVGDLAQRIGDGQVLSGRTIERSGDAVCGLHRAQADEERGFLASASKPRLMVSPGLASKPVYSSCGLTSKPLARVF